MPPILHHFPRQQGGPFTPSIWRKTTYTAEHVVVVDWPLLLGDRIVPKYLIDALDLLKLVIHIIIQSSSRCPCHFLLPLCRKNDRCKLVSSTQTEHRTGQVDRQTYATHCTTLDCTQKTTLLKLHTNVCTLNILNLSLAH